MNICDGQGRLCVRSRQTCHCAATSRSLGV